MHSGGSVAKGLYQDNDDVQRVRDAVSIERITFRCNARNAILTVIQARMACRLNHPTIRGKLPRGYCQMSRSHCLWLPDERGAPSRTFRCRGVGVTRGRSNPHLDHDLEHLGGFLPSAGRNVTVLRKQDRILTRSDLKRHALWNETE